MTEKLQPLLTQPKAPSTKDIFHSLGRHETRIQSETPTMLYPEVYVQLHLHVTHSSLYNAYIALAKESSLDCSEGK
jgi:hypothetical protein